MKKEQEQDKKFLKDIRENNTTCYPAARIVACQLSPSMLYLRNSPYGSKITESEVYCRSEKNQLTKNTQFLYSEKKKELTMGLHAHLGNYQNVMQNFGDEYSPSEKRKQTSIGDSQLYDELLEYKKSLCLRIKSNTEETEYIKIIYENSFPCIMVYVQENSIVKPKEVTSITKASHKAWVEFLISMFTGMINYYAFEKNIHLEMERRASFGFLTPTICETGESFRINMGVVPVIYADLLTDTLYKLDELIKSLHTRKIKVPSGIFYGSKLHEKYLGKQVIEIDNLAHLLFVPIETRSGLGVRNITRTSYARQGLSMMMFNKLQRGGTPLEGFAQALHWAVKKIIVKPNGPQTGDEEEDIKLVLNFDCKEQVKYSRAFAATSLSIDDQEFLMIIRKILDNVCKAILSDQMKKFETENLAVGNKIKKLYVELELRIKKIVKENIEAKQLEDLYYNLEVLNEVIFASTIFEISLETADDGYGSDSECDDEVEGEHLYAKKIITHNGMRAIWCALIAAAKYLNEQGLKSSVFMKTAYYEVEKGFKDLIKLHQIDGITIANHASEASTLIHDLNACVIDGKNKSDYTLSNKNKILILDVTSAGTAQVREHLKRFAESRALVIFLIDSGFKHQQLGADKNQYGTVRVFTKSKKTTDKIYADLVNEEKPILSMTSHMYRRKMKKIGVVPTNVNYMKLKAF